MQVPEARQGGNKSNLSSPRKSLQMRKLNSHPKTFRVVVNLLRNRIPRTGENALLTLGIGLAQSRTRAEKLSLVLQEGSDIHTEHQHAENHARVLSPDLGSPPPNLSRQVSPLHLISPSTNENAQILASQLDFAVGKLTRNLGDDGTNRLDSGPPKGDHNTLGGIKLQSSR